MQSGPPALYNAEKRKLRRGKKAVRIVPAHGTASTQNQDPDQDPDQDQDPKIIRSKSEPALSIQPEGKKRDPKISG